MSRRIMRFSVLRYTPSRAAGEYINIGVLFVDEQEHFIHFSSIKRMSRLSAFDDEVDVKGVQRLLKSIEREVVKKMDNNDFLLKDFIQYYLNGYVFSEPKKIVYDDFDKMVAMLERTYLKFDFEKKERSNRRDENQLFKKMCVAQKIDIQSNCETMGEFDEKVKYDFATKDYYIKIFDYEGKKNLVHSINSAKLWAWNAEHADKPLIILYRYSEAKETSNKDFRAIMSIFESAKIKTFDISQMDKVVSLVS